MSIEDVVYRVVHDYPGGVPALAARMGMSKHVLQNKVNPNNDTHHLTARELLRIQGLTGSKEIARYVAGESDMVCFAVTQHQGASDTDLLSLIIKANKEQADLFVCVQEAWSDGVIDPADASRIKKESYEHLAAIAELTNRIEGMVQERRKVARVK